MSMSVFTLSHQLLEEHSPLVFPAKQEGVHKTPKRANSFPLTEIALHRIPHVHSSTALDPIKPLKLIEPKPRPCLDVLGNSIHAEISQFEAQLDLQSIEQTAQHSSQTKTILKIVQLWVSDYVLKGGSTSVQVSLSTFLERLSGISHLPKLDSAVEFIRMITSVIDTGAGLTTLFYKVTILNEAQEQINALKAHTELLLPDQLARLEQLEGMIKYEKGTIPLLAVEQSIRVVKNFFSSVMFILMWIPRHALLTQLAQFISEASAGVNTALITILFYRANQDLRAHQEWSGDFKAWRANKQAQAKEQIALANHFNEVQEMAEQLKTKQTQRHQTCADKMQSVKTRLESRELTWKKVKERVKEFQCAELQYILGSLPLHELSTEEIQNRLETKLSVQLDPATVRTIHQHYLSLDNLLKMKDNPQQHVIYETKSIILHNLDACLDVWVEKQPEEKLLEAYVEYHDVLNPTLKASLTDLIDKKHQVEGGVLTFKYFNASTLFAVSTIILGVLVGLLIVGVASNPVGAAALIGLTMTAVSLTISGCLVTASYYYMYKKKPGLTVAGLQGAYLVLSSYYLMASLHSLKDRIGNYLQAAWNHKRDQISELISGLPSLPFARRQVAEEKLIEIKEQAQEKFQMSQSQAEYWTNKAMALQVALEETAWADFSKKADLKVDIQSGSHPSFIDYKHQDTLQIFNQVLSHCDLSLLSPENKELIEKQLGINLHIIEAEIQKDPLAVKKLLRNFFILDDSGYVSFIGRQRELEASKTVS
jgi:hypothetical protein